MLATLSGSILWESIWGRGLRKESEVINAGMPPTDPLYDASHMKEKFIRH